MMTSTPNGTFYIKKVMKGVEVHQQLSYLVHKSGYQGVAPINLTLLVSLEENFIFPFNLPASLI